MRSESTLNSHNGRPNAVCFRAFPTLTSSEELSKSPQSLLAREPASRKRNRESYKENVNDQVRDDKSKRGRSPGHGGKRHNHETHEKKNSNSVERSGNQIAFSQKRKPAACQGKDRCNREGNQEMDQKSQRAARPTSLEGSWSQQTAGNDLPNTKRLNSLQCIQCGYRCKVENAAKQPTP